MSSNWLRSEKREALHRRDGWACAYCGSSEKLTLDHLTPRSRGGSNAAHNLITSCGSCNSSKGAQTLAEYLEPGSPKYEEVRKKAKRRLTNILKQVRLERQLDKLVSERIEELVREGVLAYVHADIPF